MNVTIYVLREYDSIEYHFPVEVGFDSAGDLEALVGEDVPERYWTTRYGGMDLETTGYLKFCQDEEIELEDEEFEEAVEELEKLRAAWEEERSRLKTVFQTTKKSEKQEQDVQGENENMDNVIDIHEFLRDVGRDTPGHRHG